MAGPTGVDLSPAGDLIYVSVPQDNRILVVTRANSQNAAVYGQPGYTSGLANNGASPRASEATLSAPYDVKVDRVSGQVFISDAGNNRILQYGPKQTTAYSVWGQLNFNYNAPNQVKPISINAAYSIAIDYSQQPFALYLADVANHRVMGWRDFARFQNGDPADMILGQPDAYTALANFNSTGSTNATKNGLNAPRGLAVDASGNLFVADSGNNRVLRYPRPINQAIGAQPDLVIGQRDFTTNTTAPPNASNFNSPAGLAFGPDGSLLVADPGNNRVLEFAAGAFNSPAVRVYGQPDFLTGAAAPTDATTLQSPQGVFVDFGFNVYVADTAANRIVIYTDTRSATAGFSATAVLGQDSFTSSVSGAGASRLRSPFAVSVDPDTNIYISDTGNNRVVMYQPLFFLSSTGNAATAVYGQPNLNSNAIDYDTRDGQATPAGLYSPIGLLADQQGTLLIGDTGNNRLVHVLRGLSVANAANPQPGVPIAVASLVTLTGSELSTDTAQVSAPLSTNAVNREVVLDGTLPTLLSMVSPTQINLQIPSATTPGKHQIVVRTLDTQELIAGGAITVAASAPSFYTVSGDGKGQAMATNEDGSVNSASNPIARGGVITLIGTGVGMSNPPVADGVATPDGPASAIGTPSTDGAGCLRNPALVCMAVGAAFGEIQSSALQPGLIGIWQVKVKVPATTVPGATVGVRAIVNSVISTNTPTIAVK